MINETWYVETNDPIRPGAIRVHYDDRPLRVLTYHEGRDDDDIYFQYPFCEHPTGTECAECSHVCDSDEGRAGGCTPDGNHCKYECDNGHYHCGNSGRECWENNDEDGWQDLPLSELGIYHLDYIQAYRFVSLSRTGQVGRSGGVPDDDEIE